MDQGLETRLHLVDSESVWKARMNGEKSRGEDRDIGVHYRVVGVRIGR